MNETDDPFTVLENKLNENKKEKMIDELLGETVLVGKNPTVYWYKDNWIDETTKRIRSE